MITFKYQENLDHDELMSIAEQRLQRFEAVIANRGEERSPDGQQVAWLCTTKQAPQRLISKVGIAVGIADYLESLVELESLSSR